MLYVPAMHIAQAPHNALHSYYSSLYVVTHLQAFGTGALDNDDDDEDNVYGVESMTSYDITLAGEGDLSMERKFGWTGRDSQSQFPLARQGKISTSCMSKSLKTQGYG